MTHNDQLCLSDYYMGLVLTLNQFTPIKHKQNFVNSSNTWKYDARCTVTKHFFISKMCVFHLWIVMLFCSHGNSVTFCPSPTRIWSRVMLTCWFSLCITILLKPPIRNESSWPIIESSSWEWTHSCHVMYKSMQFFYTVNIKKVLCDWNTWFCVF